MVNVNTNETKNEVERKKSIVFLGSPLIDITVQVDDLFLKRYNLQPDDAYVADETNKKIFEEIKSNNRTSIGGSVTNTVRIFRKLWNFPEAITYLGTVGNDHYGHFIKNQLNQEGIGSDLMEVEENTGKVGVLLWGKARTLVTDLGASRIFPIDKSVCEKIDGACYVYFSAFFIGVSFDAIRRIFESKKCIVAVNLGAPFLSGKYPNEMIYLYKNANLVFGNEAEYRAFGEINQIYDDFVKIDQLYKNRSRVSIVTRGDKEVLVISDGKSEEFAVKAFQHEKIIDTNGAGDAFVGGFLARYVEGESLANCVQCGIRVAGQVIQSVGCDFTFSNK